MASYILYLKVPSVLQETVYSFYVILILVSKEPAGLGHIEPSGHMTKREMTKVWFPRSRGQDENSCSNDLLGLSSQSRGSERRKME